MSNYDPYRFLPNNQPPPSSSIEQIHIPIYAPPDLDPSGPLPRAESYNTNQAMAEQSEAGPSRKRPREGEGNGGNGHGHGNASSNGHGFGQGHNGAASARRPVEVPPSMFGFDARNDLTREIGTWLVKTCQGRENVEVRRATTQNEKVLMEGRDQAWTNRSSSPPT
jgi:hypothetical protein